jgi:hypothetical protein
VNAVAGTNGAHVPLFMTVFQAVQVLLSFTLIFLVLLAVRNGFKLR